MEQKCCFWTFFDACLTFCCVQVSYCEFLFFEALLLSPFYTPILKVLLSYEVNTCVWTISIFTL